MLFRLRDYAIASVPLDIPLINPTASKGLLLVYIYIAHVHILRSMGGSEICAMIRWSFAFQGNLYRLLYKYFDEIIRGSRSCARLAVQCCGYRVGRWYILCCGCRTTDITTVARNQVAINKFSIYSAVVKNFSDNSCSDKRASSCIFGYIIGNIVSIFSESS